MSKNDVMMNSNAIDPSRAEAPETYKNSDSSSNGSDISDILDLQRDEGWQDVEPDDEQVEFICFFCPNVSTAILNLMEHCREKHQFDFLKIRNDLGTYYFQ